MKKQVLIFLDRDGTIIYDNKYHLGRQRNWKSLVKFLPGVIKGIKKLNKLNYKIYMITNQPGVAIKDFPLLTRKRAEEVCQFVIDELEKKGARIEGYEICGHYSQKYADEKTEYKFNKELVCNCSCIKPKPGMINDILKKEKIKKSNTKIYVVGDRVTDVEAGINAGGFGILVPFSNTKNQLGKMKKIKSKKKHLSKNFLGATDFILKKEKS